MALRNWGVMMDHDAKLASGLHGAHLCRAARVLFLGTIVWGIVDTVAWPAIAIRG